LLTICLHFTQNVAISQCDITDDFVFTVTAITLSMFQCFILGFSLFCCYLPHAVDLRKTLAAFSDSVDNYVCWLRFGINLYHFNKYRAKFCCF